MNSHSDLNDRLLVRIRALVAFFIFGLVVSGVTAIPLETEVTWMADWMRGHLPASSPMMDWIGRVQGALHDTNARYPFIAYGADWLAFGHFMIALAFVWAWREPVRNRWLFDFGLIACALVVPFALIMGGERGIPWWWRAVDCSFGVFGAIPLWLCRRYARQLAGEESA